MNPLLTSLPANPLATLADWLREAKEKNLTPNHNAMVLSTLAVQKGELLPSSRVVLCKHLNTEDGYVVFYSNYQSRKGRELAALRNVAAVFHWDHTGRQARVEGLVFKSPAEESDAYFASRPRGSQLSAWASAQSEPIASRKALQQQLDDVEKRFADTEIIPRPSHWGGYRLWISAIELWVQGDSRLHDRARWIRTLAIDDNEQLHPDSWTAARLQP